MKEFAAFILLLLAIIGSYSYSFISVDLATFLVFILVLGLLIYRDRKKVDFDKIVFMRRTKRGRNFIDCTARKHPNFWKSMGSIGIVVGVVVLVLGSLFLVTQAASVATGAKEGGVRLLLPGPVSAPTSLPGVFVVPWWIWVIGVAVVIIPHEFFHGIMCRVDKVRIKSVGWLLLLIIPGAFVEPDERQLKKARRSTKLKVFAAGSFANIITAAITILILVILIYPSFSPNGLLFTANDSSVFERNITGSLIAIDNINITSHDDLVRILSNHKPGDNVEVKFIENKNIAYRYFLPPITVNKDDSIKRNVRLLENPKNTSSVYLGISASSRTYAIPDMLPIDIISLLIWIQIFSLGIGIVNMLPIKPLDGGLLFEELVGKRKHAGTIVKSVGAVMLIILLFNLIGPVFL